MIIHAEEVDGIRVLAQDEVGIDAAIYILPDEGIVTVLPDTGALWSMRLSSNKAIREAVEEQDYDEAGKRIIRLYRRHLAK